jgi:hypothetical protein
MNTFDTTMIVLADGTAIVSLPRGMAPGSYRVAVVVAERLEGDHVRGFDDAEDAADGESLDTESLDGEILQDVFHDAPEAHPRPTPFFPDNLVLRAGRQDDDVLL